MCYSCLERSACGPLLLANLEITWVAAVYRVCVWCVTAVLFSVESSESEYRASWNHVSAMLHSKHPASCLVCLSVCLSVCIAAFLYCRAGDVSWGMRRLDLLGLEWCGRADGDDLDVLKCKDDADLVWHCTSMAEDGIRHRRQWHRRRTWLNRVKKFVLGSLCSEQMERWSEPMFTWRITIKMMCVGMGECVSM